MSWLTPLGFLGLIGIIILIIIYIIKPNYQQKFISSTFVWKLSLKYRKKRIPISKLRNILLFLCQILVITSCAFILAHPILDSSTGNENKEKVIILEVSAGMLTEDTAGFTRLDRAIEGIKSVVEDNLDAGGVTTVILAEEKANFLIQRASVEMKEEIVTAINSLSTDLEVNYSTPDIDGAISLSEKVLEENPKAEVLLYTDAEYLSKGNIQVNNVSKPEEWNASILDCRAEIVENLYVFTVEFISYNRPIGVNVCCVVTGVNGDENEQMTFDTLVNVNENEKTTVRFNADFYKNYIGNDGTSNWIYSFKEAYFYIEMESADSFPYDNEFYIYGGETERIDIQYFSGVANPFIEAALGSVGEELQYKWDVYVDTLKNGEQPKFEEFDMYVFEHVMPEYLPDDGVVFLLNPGYVPDGLDIQLGPEYSFANEVSLTSGEKHDITRFVTPEDIKVKQNRIIEWYGEGFTPLIYCEGNPVLLVKDTGTSKIIVLTCHLNYSDFAVKKDFPILIYNILNYYFPATINNYVYNVGETVALDARGDVLTLENPYSETTEFNYSDLPTTITLSTKMRGIYSLNQTLISGEDITEYFFARVPASESNIFAVEDELLQPSINVPDDDTFNYKDLLIYFLAALVALMFIEWWLQSQEGI